MSQGDQSDEPAVRIGLDDEATLAARRNADIALHEREERFRLIVERATDYAIFSTDRERRIDSWSPGAAAIFGWTESEAIGQLMDVTYVPPDRAARVPEIEFTTARDTGHSPNVRWHQRRDGTWVFIEGDAYARRGADGTFYGVFKIGQDISHRIAMEEAERDAEVARRGQEAAARDLLAEQVALATQEVRTLSRRLLLVQEEERRRLALELHDEVGQMLTGLSLQLAAVAGKSGMPALDEAQRLIVTLTEQVRQLALDLRPAVLDRYGLRVAVEWYIDRYQRQTGVKVTLKEAGLTRRFAPEVEIVAFRVVQESLTNVARHSGAGVATVTILADRSMIVEIRDAGHGFAAGVPKNSTGLSGMRERVALLEGTLEVDTRPGGGTRILANIPISQLFASAQPMDADPIDAST